MENTKAVKLPLIAKFLRSYLRSNFRGQTRLTFFLARHLRSLQAVPISIEDWPPVYMDLRFGGTHTWLKGSPWASSQWEAAEQNIMSKLVSQGDIVFDIGANIGLHTALLSKLVGPNGRVVAFEPNPELIPSLSRTISSLCNAELHQLALSDLKSQTTLFVPENPEMASLADWTSERDDVLRAHPVTCEQRRLDDLIDEHVIPQPDFIKCDAEGAELMIFRGGQQTLNRTDAPTILFECSIYTAENFGLKATDVLDFLEALRLARFQFYNVERDGLSSLRPSDIEHTNVIAIPESKAALAHALIVPG